MRFLLFCQFIHIKEWFELLIGLCLDINLRSRNIDGLTHAIHSRPHITKILFDSQTFGMSDASYGIGIKFPYAEAAFITVGQIRILRRQFLRILYFREPV